MLLIPRRIRQLRREGRQQARQEQRKRMREAYERFGIEVDGVRVLPDTPEVQAFLDSETGDSDPG